MGTPVKFPGMTHDFGPPPGREEDVGRLPCFLNGTCVVSIWDLSNAEIDEIVRTRRVAVSVMSGTTVLPLYVGSESSVRGVVVDYGRVW